MKIQQFKIDMHCHTQFLDFVPSRLVFHYLRRKRASKGVHICVMNHNTTFDAGYYEKFGCFAGEEVSVRDGRKKYHLGLLGIGSSVRPNYMAFPYLRFHKRSVEDLVNEVHARGGVVILHHPEDFRFYDLVDVIELMNGKYKDRTLKTLSLWEDAYLSGNFKPISAGSDFHLFLDDKDTFPYTVLMGIEMPSLDVLVSALTSGKSYVTYGPEIFFEVECTLPGGKLGLISRKFVVGLKSNSRGKILLRKNRDIVWSGMGPCDTAIVQTLENGDAFYRVEIWHSNRPVLVSNPVHLFMEDMK